MKFLAYKLVEDVDLRRFEATIDALLREGWEPQGGILLLPRRGEGISDTLLQAMAKVQREGRDGVASDHPATPLDPAHDSRVPPHQ